MSDKSSNTAVRTPNDGLRVASAGNIYRMVVTGEDTNNRYSLVECVVEPGQGAPYHIHAREEEAFIITEGEMVFYTGAERIVAKTGTLINCPVETMRGFRNETDQTARMLILLAPSGMEQMFIEDGIVLSENAERKSTKGLQPSACPTLSAKYGITNVAEPLPVPQDRSQMVTELNPQHQPPQESNKRKLLY